MKRTDRASQSEAKIQAALDNMRQSFSPDEFMPWNSGAIVKMYRIGGAFPTVLKNLKAIEMKHGMVKLTLKMATLRASTVRKNMNEYVNKSNRTVKVKALKSQPELPFKTEAPSDIKEVVIALKKQLREEILQELLAGLSK